MKTVRRKLGEAYSFIKKNAYYLKKEPLILLLIAGLGVLVIVFWMFFLLLACALAILALALKIKYREPSLKELFEKKRTLLKEIKIAEGKFLKRKLSQKHFNEIFKEKQETLIKLEALIDERYNKEKTLGINTVELEKVRAKKRHILQELLEEKKRYLKEVDIAQKKYLKRKIDNKTFQEIVRENQKRLIAVEAQIKELYSQKNIENVLMGLKKKLDSIEKQREDRLEAKKKKREAETLEIAKELVEQIRNEARHNK
jgi:hypothetical protein